MSSAPPPDDVGDIDRVAIVRDRTPEREEIERGVAPVDGGGLRASRVGVGAGLAAVVAALLLINFAGRHDRLAPTTMAMTPDAKAHPDQHAKQDVPFDPISRPAASPVQPVTAAPGTGTTALPNGTVVPAIEPGAMPADAGTASAAPAAALAQRIRHAPLLVPVSGADQERGSDGPNSVGAIGQGNAEDPTTARPAAGELDRLRQTSAIASTRASLLPSRDYLVTAGTLIPCILQTAMNSTQPGYTSCIVPRDVYSDDGRVVLLDKGTKVLGQYQGGINQGQGRIFVLWTRAVTPRGVAVDLASPASDALGRAGMAGAVDTFFWARFGAALMLSLIDDASSIASAHLARQGSYTVQVPSTTAGTALNGTINIKPVLKKNQGEEVAIFVAQDVNFADVYRLRLRP